ERPLNLYCNRARLLNKNTKDTRDHSRVFCYFKWFCPLSWKTESRANPPFAEVAEVRFFCFFFLVKKRKVLKVLCILVISMQGFVGRANSLAEHTLYGHKV